MFMTKFCKCIVLAAAVLAVPLSAQAQPYGGRCDAVYQRAFDSCRSDRAYRCDQARHHARRACSHGGRYDCHRARRHADGVCSARGCRSHAEDARRACFRNRHHHYRRY